MSFKYYKTERLIILIIALCVLFGFISAWTYSLLEKTEPLKSLVLFTDSCTVPFFVSIVIYCINNYWWKHKWMNWLINIPNLNGRYEGKLVSSFIESEKPKDMDCVLEIKQSASAIHVFGYFGNMDSGFVSSSSQSATEEIIRENNGFFILYYIFSNETGGIGDKLNNHTGTAKLSYYPDKKMFEGSYYNKLKNTGVIKVVLKQKQLLGRLLQ